ncbi:MAG: hypothetical protein KGK09_01520, partial [Burkholderiales bacterium]|nr:hypothetical protein [Burkholderiales bacterium]
EWRGSGLGGLLQRRLAAHARGRGVRGFVAELLASNEHMLHLARGGPAGGEDGGTVQIEDQGGTLRVTRLFGDGPRSELGE